MKITGKSTGKYIGINQRVPFDVLDAGLYRFLRDQTIDRDLIITHLREFTKGENRVLKAAQYAVQILSSQERCINELKKHVDADTFLKLPDSDRKTIILCLTALAFPVTYNLLIALASGFKVQANINRQFMNQKMSAMYGSNRSVYHAMDAIIPMIIELGTIERIKRGLYALAQKTIITQPVIKELVIYTDIKLSGSKSILADELQHRPWYMFFELSLGKKHKYTLFKYSESRIGQGYLTI